MPYKIGDRFIIEIDRIYSSEKHEVSRYGIKGFANFVLDKRKLDELLKHGNIEDADEALKAAFFNGAENEKELWEDIEECKEILEKEYQRGLDDAWAAAKRIVEIDVDEWEECFGDTNDWPINCATAQEAIEKLKVHDEKKKAEAEIKVGDEISDGNNRGIVTMVEDDLSHVYVMMDDGMLGYWTMADWPEGKTGRHFPQIAEMLKAMRDE